MASSSRLDRCALCNTVEMCHDLGECDRDRQSILIESRATVARDAMGPRNAFLLPDFDAPCPHCGKPNDHMHTRWDGEKGCWVVMR